MIYDRHAGGPDIELNALIGGRLCLEFDAGLHADVSRAVRAHFGEPLMLDGDSIEVAGEVFEQCEEDGRICLLAPAGREAEPLITIFHAVRSGATPWAGTATL